MPAPISFVHSQPMPRTVLSLACLFQLASGFPDPESYWTTLLNANPDILLHRTSEPFTRSPFSRFEGLGGLRVYGGILERPTLSRTGSPRLEWDGGSDEFGLTGRVGGPVYLHLGREYSQSTMVYGDASGLRAEWTKKRRDFPFILAIHPLAEAAARDTKERLDIGSRPDENWGFLIQTFDENFDEFLLGTYLDFNRRFTLELSYASIVQTENLEVRDAAIPDSAIRAVYRSRHPQVKATLRYRRLSDTLEAFAGYLWSRSDRPEAEYWLADSTRRLDLGLRGARSAAQWRASVSANWAQSLAFSIGRRTPPGSEGLKRLHFARNHSFRLSLEVQAHRNWSAEFARGDVGILTGYSIWDFGSRPPPGALDQRDETLSYNRLGVSFIPDLLGAFNRTGALVRAEGRLQSFSAGPDASCRWGPVRVQASLLGGWHLQSWSTLAQNVSKTLFSTDTSASYNFRAEGTVWTLTPRLQAAFRLGPAGLEAGGAQALLLHDDVKTRTGDGDTQHSLLERGHYAIGKNALEYWMRAFLEF